MAKPLDGSGLAAENQRDPVFMLRGRSSRRLAFFSELRLESLRQITSARLLLMACQKVGCPLFLTPVVCFGPRVSWRSCTDEKEAKTSTRDRFGHVAPLHEVQVD